MIKKIAILLISLFTVNHIIAQTEASKLRVIVLTDIENEPDDAMSMVRFLTYSNEWDVEGLNPVHYGQTHRMKYLEMTAVGIPK